MKVWKTIFLFKSNTTNLYNNNNSNSNNSDTCVDLTVIHQDATGKQRFTEIPEERKNPGGLCCWEGGLT